MIRITMRNMREKMKADVIIPVYKPDQRLHALLERLRKQTVQPGKILLMNTEERYFDPGICEGIAGVEVHHVPKAQFDHGGTRHQAVQYSDADILVFMTQDAMPKDRHLLEELIRPLTEGKASVSYARQLPAPDCRELERYTRAFNYPPQSCIKSAEDLEWLGIKTFFCSNVCAAYLRRDYDAMGGFIRKTIFNEDMIMAGRMIQSGKRIAYTAQARVVHSHNYTGSMQFHRNFDLAVSQADHPEIFSGISSQKEGIRLVKETALHFLRTGKPWLIGELIIKSGCKFLGYRLGKNYRKLPKKVIKYCTMNPSYWDF